MDKNKTPLPLGIALSIIIWILLSVLVLLQDYLIGGKIMLIGFVALAINFIYRWLRPYACVVEIDEQHLHIKYLFKSSENCSYLLSEIKSEILLNTEETALTSLIYIPITYLDFQTEIAGIEIRNTIKTQPHLTGLQKLLQIENDRFLFSRRTEKLNLKKLERIPDGIDELKGKTLDEINALLAEGARFVTFEYCISIVVFSFKRTSRIHFLKKEQSAVFASTPYVLLSSLFGWIGIPHGVVWTMNALVVNFTGGKDVTYSVVKSTFIPIVVEDLIDEINE